MVICMRTFLKYLDEQIYGRDIFNFCFCYDYVFPAYMSVELFCMVITHNFYDSIFITKFNWLLYKLVGVKRFFFSLFFPCCIMEFQLKLVRTRKICPGQVTESWSKLSLLRYKFSFRNQFTAVSGKKHEYVLLVFTVFNMNSWNVLQDFWRSRRLIFSGVIGQKYQILMLVLLVNYT